ncbi:transcriptional regulator domain-containing protein [Sphingomonas sp. 179-A 2A2 NHS]|uniref:transcriptional regulator domain-containing protein n=1 Tax=Sphingomonas sp. 179-A 2A2 NHS TaxID=3374290 RepID=UPI00387A103F
MGRAPESRPDWRDSAPYRALIGIDRAGLAWEWLRRDPAYAALSARLRGADVSGDAHLQMEAGARAFGLCFRRRRCAACSSGAALMACRPRSVRTAGAGDPGGRVGSGGNQPCSPGALDDDRAWRRP